MITPDLKEIFFNFDFTEDTIPELEAARIKSKKALDEVAEAHKLAFKEYDKLTVTAANEALYSQCLGFMQGFKWAVYLFTGHKDEGLPPQERGERCNEYNQFR